MTTAIDKPTKTIRPSSANLYAKCVAGAHGDNDQFQINWNGGAAIVGSALHEAAKALVLKESIPHDEIQRKYALNKAQRRDLEILIACVRKYCLDQLHDGGWANTLVAEQRLEGRFETERCVYNYNLGGTMDVGGFSRDRTIWGTIDWKTTRLENADYAAQQMIYLWLAKEWIQANLPQKSWPAYYQYHIVFVRDWTEEVSEAYTAEELDNWLAGFLDRLESWNGREYNPGGHCLFCPRQADCPAVYRLVSAMAMALRDEGFTDTAENASDQELVDFYCHGTAVVNLVNNAKQLLKSMAVGRGGEIAGSQGVLTTILKPKYDIDPQTAWPICEAHLSEQQIANATKLSKTALLDGVSENTPKGLKKKAKDAFWEKLCDAGAVETDQILELRLKKARVVESTFEN